MKKANNISQEESCDIQKSDLTELVLNPLSDLIAKEGRDCIQRGVRVYDMLVEICGMVEAIGGHLKRQADRDDQ
jgi:hypothetical protein